MREWTREYDKEGNLISSSSNPEKEQEIIIVMDGGLIQEIKKPDNLDVKIRIRDYDIEGLDEDDISIDKTGKECYEYYEVN